MWYLIYTEHASSVLDYKSEVPATLGKTSVVRRQKSKELPNILLLLSGGQLRPFLTNSQQFASCNCNVGEPTVELD